jgi:hypothetical protein
MSIVLAALVNLSFGKTSTVNKAESGLLKVKPMTCAATAKNKPKKGQFEPSN